MINGLIGKIASIASSKITYILIGVVATFATAAYGYFKHTNEQIEILRQNNAELQAATTIQRESIVVLQERIVVFEKANIELRKRLDQAEESKSVLIEKLQQHDLTRLSRQKPGLIEKRVNDATKKIFDDIEAATAE